tara:strand:- start:571 stop:1752 length:1182 start_codon:yes stop_codon:yes gene_type:complete
MKEIRSNINIIGGGLIGASVGYSLSLLGYKITIIEKNNQYNSAKDKDHRTIAVSEGTKNFLTNIDIWPSIKNFSQPIKKIKVIDRKISNILEFDNNRRGSNLGYIVKNKYLLDILYKKLKNNKNITILNNSLVESFQMQNDCIITNLGNQMILSDLNIAADGKKSSVRKYLKTPIFNKNYKKSALVLTFTHSKNHNSTAFEFFYKNGPLAILPMQKVNNTFVSSIVWTDDSGYLEQVHKTNNKNLLSILNQNTQHVIGNINKILTKQLFPITAHLNTSFFKQRTIYIGDAAHSFHPIAGQGWNLGMKDVENLFYLAKNYKALGIDVGDNIFCKKYHNENFYNAFRLYQVTDKLDHVFKNQNPLLTIGRKLGLSFIQKNKKINNMISDFAMGIN